jgi:hypothetical protein
LTKYDSTDAVLANFFPREKRSTFMISFAAPWYLLLMPLAAGPFVLHLLNRRKMKRTQFSSLFFLRKLRERRFRWLRLRDLLLLIFRSLFLAFLVLALAGPVWKGRFPLGKERADVVLILDDSYSTEPRFADLKLTALRVLDELSSGSRVALLTPSGALWDTTWSVPPSGNTNNTSAPQTEWGDRVQALTPSQSGRDLQAAWNMVCKLLTNSSAATRRIVIVSDGQKRALDFLTRERIGEDIEVHCFLNQTSPPANTSILDAELYPVVPLPGEGQTVRASIRHSGKSTQKQITLWVDDRVVDERKLNLSAAERDIEFKLAHSGREVKVALEPDSISADDERFVLASGAKTLRVALVGDADSYFLELALRAGSGVSVQKVSPASAATLSPLAYDILIWDGASAPSAEISAAASRGLAVLVLLDGEVADVEGVFNSRGGVSQQGFDILAPSSLFADLEEKDRRQIRINRYARLQPVAGKVVLSLSGGDPFLITDTSQGISYLVTRFTPQHTDLVYRALFPALLNRLVVFVAGERTERERFIGDTLRVRVSAGKAILVETPHLHYELAPHRMGTGYEIEFASTLRAGFYKIGPQTFVVNPDPAEVSSARINSADLQKRGIEVYPLGVSTPRNLWLWFLILAAACLAVELSLVMAHAFASRRKPGDERLK